MASYTRSPSRLLTTQNAGGSVSWSGLTDLYTSNDVRATAALNNNQSQSFVVGGFSFGNYIPYNSVVTGIAVSIEKSRTAGAGTLSDTLVKLVRAGVVQGVNKASSGADWTGTDATSTYGGEGDTWGTTWSVSDLADISFGVLFSCTETAGVAATAGVDHISVTVYYTSGYLSGGQVQNAGEVILFGQRYRLAGGEDGKAGRVGVTLATTFPQKIDTAGPLSRPSNPIVETYLVDDLRGGEGLAYYRTPEDLNRYHYSSSGSVDGRWKRAITMGPYVNTTGTQPTTATITGIGSLGSSSNIVVAYGAALYNWSGSAWSALIDTLPAAIAGPPAEFNGRLYWPEGSTGYSYQATTASVATDVAAGAADPGAVYFVVWDSQIWAVDTVGKLWKSSSGNAASWTGLATLPPMIGGTTLTNPKTQLVVYDDASGDPTIWALTSWGPYIYDAVNDKWFQSRFSHPPHYLTVQAGEAAQAVGIVFRDSLYVRYGDLKLAKLTMVNGTLVVDPNAGPFYPDGPRTGQEGYISAFAADNDLLFCAVTRKGSGTYKTLFVTDGNGWHPIWGATVGHTDDELHHLKIFHSSSGYRLYTHAEITGPSDSLVYIDLEKFKRHPVNGSGSEFFYDNVKSLFSIYLPLFDAWNRSQIKIIQQVRLKVSGTASGTYLTIVGVPDLTKSVTFSRIIDTDAEVTISFGEGQPFRTWQFQIYFDTTSNTSAPKLEYVALDYVRKEEVQRGFQFTLDLSTPYAGRTPTQMTDDLWSHMKSLTWGTFVYRDDANNDRSCMVKVMRPSGEENTGRDASGKYTVLCIEMGQNHEGEVYP